MPKGKYKAKLSSCEPITAKTGTPGVKLTLVVVEPVEHAGRKLWYDLWLTELAMPSTKRDLAKIGITYFEHLDLPVPDGIFVAVQVALRNDDDGTERNKITRFDVDRKEQPPPNPFPPVPDADSSDQKIPSPGSRRQRGRGARGKRKGL